MIEVKVGKQSSTMIHPGNEGYPSFVARGGLAVRPMMMLGPWGPS